MTEGADEDVIDWVTRWFAAQCNGDWEHQFGLRIETTDNPGWHVEIDLTGTELEGRSFAIGAGSGYTSRVVGAQYKASG